MTETLPEGQLVCDGAEYQFTYAPCCGRENKFHWNLVTRKGYCVACHTAITGYRNLRKFIENEDLTEFGSSFGSMFEPNYTIKELQTPEIEINAWFEPTARRFLILRGVSQQQALDIPILYHPKGYIKIPVKPMSPELPKVWLKRYFRYEKSKWHIS